jgi:hypothetical protein
LTCPGNAAYHSASPDSVQCSVLHGVRTADHPDCPDIVSSYNNRQRFEHNALSVNRPDVSIESSAVHGSHFDSLLDGQPHHVRPSEEIAVRLNAVRRATTAENDERDESSHAHVRLEMRWPGL